MLVSFNGRVDAAKTCVATADRGVAEYRPRRQKIPDPSGSPEILASWKGQSKPVMVDVDIETEGDAQTFSYMCVITQGSAFVQRTMN